MSRLSGALGALQGLEKGMIGRDQAKSQLAQTLFDLRKYQETTLPESQAQVVESTERGRYYAAQTGLAQEELRTAPTKRLTALADLETSRIKLEEAQKRHKELQKFADANPDVPVWSGGLGRKTAAEVKQAELDYYKAQDDLAIQKGWGAGGGVAETVRGKVAATRETTQKAVTGAIAEETFAKAGGAGLEAQAREVRLKTEIQRGPIDIEQASQEMTQAQLTTQFMQADTPAKIASIPLTQQLLKTQVKQAEQNLSVSQTYDMQQAQANLANIQTNISRTKQEMQRIGTEMKDKAALDGIAANSGLTNPITNKPVTTWKEYDLVMNFKLDEQLAMVRAISSGGGGYPTMSQVIKQITVANDKTLFGGQIPFKSEEMVRNFISYIPFFLTSGQDPNAAWALSKMVYVTSEPLDTLRRKADASDDTLSKRFLADYLPADMVVSDEQIQRVTTAIQQALSERARTSAAGGTITPPTITGPPTGIAPGATKRPPPLREQVAGAPGSVTETFGLDAATKQRIASIIDVYRNDPSLQQRIIDEAMKETDLQKQDAIGNFANWYYNKR